MTSLAPEPCDVVVVGPGPAGVVAALRACRLGARTALITRDEFGGMAADDGPVPVRTLAQAARLIREARQLIICTGGTSRPLAVPGSDLCRGGGQLCQRCYRRLPRDGDRGTKGADFL
jgi:alkyl hydroperoxide reductase subunit AhpF